MRLTTWKTIELSAMLDRRYSPRIFEHNKAIATRVMRNIAAMQMGYLDPARLPA